MRWRARIAVISQSTFESLSNLWGEVGIKMFHYIKERPPAEFGFIYIWGFSYGAIKHLMQLFFLVDLL